MRESRLIQTIKRNVKRDYPSAFCVKLADKATRGLPDLLLIHNGLHLFIETKVDKNALSPIQQAVHGEIRRAGGDVIVARSWSDVQELLSRCICRAAFCKGTNIESSFAS